jgi:UDP-N-acetylmuramate: L-alanyl-gamma-D-glutamyl-meso-diaminopimelate ligase
VVLAPLYAPEKVPDGERLDVEKLAADLRREDVPARLIPTVEATVAQLAERASPGDTVLIMSSGDYGGLHEKLLTALGDPVMPARIQHKPRIAALLDRIGIAHPVLEQHWADYLIIPGDGEDAPLVGCVALELAGDVALLRMLAVAPERRGEGLGYVLVEAATERARAFGVGQLYLVTDGAQGYFGEKLGFRAVDRKEVAAEIAATAEYALARSKNATWMRKDL